jgi:ribonuclease T1
MTRLTAQRSWLRTSLGLAVAVVVALLLWWVQGDTEPAQETGSGPGTLPVVALADLPPEAQDTLDLIDAGGPYPYDQDDGVFSNREELLPDQPEGYYREYTVDTPGSDDRGARRMVTGDGGELYWTDDHYASFARIER